MTGVTRVFRVRLPSGLGNGLTLERLRGRGSQLAAIKDLHSEAEWGERLGFQRAQGSACGIRSVGSRGESSIRPTCYRAYPDCLYNIEAGPISSLPLRRLLPYIGTFNLPCAV